MFTREGIYEMNVHTRKGTIEVEGKRPRLKGYMKRASALERVR